MPDDLNPIFMERAIALAVENVRSGRGGPFAAVIVREGKIIGEGTNSVTTTNDPTAHGEINAIRDACRALNTFSLKGCVIYTSCEPCPMCLAAIHWAKIDRVVYGATIDDAARAGFCELHVDAQALAQMGRSPLKVESGLLRAECAALFQQWREAGLCQAY